MLRSGTYNVVCVASSRSCKKQNYKSPPSVPGGKQHRVCSCCRSRQRRVETVAKAAPSEPRTEQKQLPDTRRAFVLAVGMAASTAALPAVPPAWAVELETATFAGGDPVFLEGAFDNLRYAGVADVIMGTVLEDGVRVRAVRVAFNAASIPYLDLLKAYWKAINPTQADGQFESKGPESRAVIWCASAAQRAAAERTKQALQASGVFGPGSVVATAILDGPADGAFEAAPEAERGLGRRDAAKLEALRVKTGRKAYFDKQWGLSTFCVDRVCGYVRFARACTAECYDVYPELRDQPGTYAS